MVNRHVNVLTSNISHVFSGVINRFKTPAKPAPKAVARPVPMMPQMSMNGSIFQCKHPDLPEYKWYDQTIIEGKPKTPTPVIYEPPVPGENPAPQPKPETKPTPKPETKPAPKEDPQQKPTQTLSVNQDEFNVITKKDATYKIKPNTKKDGATYIDTWAEIVKAKYDLPQNTPWSLIRKLADKLQDANYTGENRGNKAVYFKVGQEVVLPVEITIDGKTIKLKDGWDNDDKTPVIQSKLIEGNDGVTANKQAGSTSIVVNSKNEEVAEYKNEDDAMAKAEELTQKSFTYTFGKS